METSGHSDDQKDADECGDSDGQPFVGDNVEIEHQRHARRHEKEGHIADEKSAYRRDGLGTDYLAVKQKSQYQHTDDASRHRQARNHCHEFACKQTCENNTELFCHMCKRWLQR